MQCPQAQSTREHQRRQVAISFSFIFLFPCLQVLLETTETTCKSNSFFLAAKPRGALETGRGLVRSSLGEGGYARMAKVVFISCHGCFLFTKLILVYIPVQHEDNELSAAAIVPSIAIYESS